MPASVVIGSCKGSYSISTSITTPVMVGNPTAKELDAHIEGSDELLLQVVTQRRMLVKEKALLSQKPTPARAYTVEEQHILRKMSYHWAQADDAVLNFPFCQKPFNIPLKPDPTGAMLFIPVEILHKVFFDLDFTSLEALRRTDSRTRSVVDVFHLYKEITTIAPGTLRGLFATKVMPHFSARDIYITLCSDRCSACGHFGPFLFLPKCVRCCWSCLNSLSGDVFKVYSVIPSNKEERRLPVAHVVFGKYGIEQHDIMSSSIAPGYHFVSSQHLTALGVLLPAQASFPSSTSRGQSRTGIRGPFRTGDMDRDWAISRNKIPRYMVTAPFPTLNTITREVEKGVYCRGCEAKRWRSDAFLVNIGVVMTAMNKAYSSEEFLAHFKVCKTAAKLWKHLKEGWELVQIDPNHPWRRDGDWSWTGW